MSSSRTSSPRFRSLTTGRRDAWGFEKSQILYDHLQASGHVDRTGRIQDSLREAIKDDTLALPEEFAGQRDDIISILRRLAGRLEIRNADERQIVRPRQAILDSTEFKALWDRIKHKTTYRVTFDNEALIVACAKRVVERAVDPEDPAAMA